MIIVTGATGKLGRSIVEQLLERMTPDQIGVSVRDPDQAGWIAERGVRVRQGDYDNSDSLRHAFEGASQVLLISANTSGEEAIRLHATAIDAAGAVGAKRVVYTSHVGARPDSPFPPMPDHAATEAKLRTSGMAFAVLRNGFYADSALMLMGDFAQSGKIVAPADGPVSWTTHADLAEAAAIVLSDPAFPDEMTHPLTNTEALDLADLAASASELTGRTITRLTVSDDDYRATMIARGVPAQSVDFLLGLFAASCRGDFSTVDPTLERLLSRRPQSMAEVLKARFSQ